MTSRLIKMLTVPAVLLGLDYVFDKHINPYIAQIIILCGINIIMTVSLNLINGFTGQFSLGHAGFMAVGAYTSAALSVYAGVPEGAGAFVENLIFLFYLTCGAGVSAFFGYLIALPSLRLRGDYLAIVTLGFGEIIRVLILNIDLIGGARGFSNIPPYAGFFWVFLWAVITVFVIWRMVYSVKGKSFMAVREDEIASQSIGIPPVHVKVTAFVVGAFFAGIGGGLFAHFIAYLNPSSFTFLKSIEIVVMVVVGGMGSITGSVISGVLLTVAPEALRVASEYRMVAYALLLILIMILKPAGLMGTREFRWRIGKR